MSIGSSPKLVWLARSFIAFGALLTVGACVISPYGEGPSNYSRGHYSDSGGNAYRGNHYAYRGGYHDSRSGYDGHEDGDGRGRL